MKQQFPTKITVSVVPLNRVVNIHNDSTGHIWLSGADGRLLSILSQVLHFQYYVRVPEDREWGRLASDGNWTGMIGQVNRGAADFTMTWTSHTKERQAAVDFSEPYAVNEITYVTTLPSFLPKAYSFFYPFDIATWCSIVLLVLVTPLIFCLISTYGQTYFDRLLYLYGSIMHQPLVAESFYSKILLSFWWFGAIVLSISYSGVLSSFLSIPLRNAPIKNFHEMALAVAKGQYRLLDVKGTVSLPAFLESGKEDLVFLAKTMMQNEWYTTFAESQTEDFLDGRTAHLGARQFLYFRFGKAPLTRMYITEDTAISTGISLGVRKDFCCLDALNAVIIKINGAGIYQKILDDEMFKSWLEYVGSIIPEERDIPISIYDLSVAMIILVTGFSFALLSLILEILVVRIQGNSVFF